MLISRRVVVSSHESGRHYSHTKKICLASAASSAFSHGPERKLLPNYTRTEEKFSPAEKAELLSKNTKHSS